MSSPTGRPSGAPVPTAASSAPLRFPPHSRYAGTEVVTRVEADGSETRYLRRRFIPEAPAVAGVEHVVVDGDRPDLLAQRYYADPLLAWRIADANEVADPADLTATPGHVVAIPTPDSSGGLGGTA